MPDSSLGVVQLLTPRLKEAMMPEETSADAWKVRGWGACTYPTRAFSEKHAIQMLMEGAKGRSMRWYERLMRKGAR